MALLIRSKFSNQVFNSTRNWRNDSYN